MKQIQLYIEDQRVELFKDESIVLTQTVQNVRDVGKVFTPFSRSFTCPASKINNKIFKHFYNFSIIDAIDPRLRMDARIDINHSRFEKGKIKLEGVQMENNKPHAYRITFFGATVTLKDKFRNDKLDSLDFLRNFNFTYNSANVIQTLQNGKDITHDGIVYNDAFVVPLITHEDRLFYDSASPGDNNLFFDPNNVGGVDFQQLKPAIRMDIIVKAIEKQYDIQFSNDFFSDTNPVYYDLYMWMHRKKGSIQEASTGPDTYIRNFEFPFVSWGNRYGLKRNDFETDSDGYHINGIITQPDNGFSASIEENVLEVPTNTRAFRILHKFRPQDQAIPYKIVVKKRGEIIYTSEEVTGNHSFSIHHTSNGNVVTEIHTQQTMIFDSLTLRVFAEQWFGYVPTEEFVSNQLVISPDFKFDSTKEIPEISVIDFLSGLFKLFNLVAYVDYDGIIQVKTLDSWFDESDKTFDLTKYIDSKKSTIDIALPYREILFDYEGKKSFFAANHNALFNYEHGVERYRGEDDELLSGSDYRIKVPFEHHKYERLYNQGTATSVQWGWSVDDNMQSILGKPLLFYPIRISDETPIAAKSTSSAHQEILSYYIPSNSRSIDSNVSTENINFRAEVNEYTATIFDQTLFAKYYKNYISDTFNPSRRLSKFTAKLPMSFLLNYELNDQVIIFDRLYRINEIETNLATGISKIELINISESIVASQLKDVQFLTVDSIDGDSSEATVSIDLESVTDKQYP